MPAIMVQGVSSWAGKSLLTTALARHFARRVDGAGDGLGLLPLVTTFAAEKATLRTTARFGEPGRHARSRRA